MIHDRGAVDRHPWGQSGRRPGEMKDPRDRVGKPSLLLPRLGLGVAWIADSRPDHGRLLTIIIPDVR